jgi:hypothetical protein
MRLLLPIVCSSDRSSASMAEPNDSAIVTELRVPGISGVRQTARVRKQERFTALLHHLTIDLLRESYFALQLSAAPGVDGVRWQQYEQGLEADHPLGGTIASVMDVAENFLSPKPLLVSTL